MNDPVDPVERSADERDRFRDWDAAYVLGALSPDDRRAYERHLANTPARAAEVAELAGLPGILGKLSADEAVLLLAGPSAVAPSPAVADARHQHHKHLSRSGHSHSAPTVVRRRRLRITFSAVAAGVAALLVAGSLFFGVTLAPSTNEANPAAPSATPSAPAELAMTPIVPGVMTANLAVTEKGWGTRFDWNCQYTSGGWGTTHSDTTAPVDYDLVITDTSGTQTTVATWSATQNGAAGLVASTSVPTANIRSVEIRPTGSSTVLVRTDL
jgi:hypothetical protein